MHFSSSCDNRICAFCSSQYDVVCLTGGEVFHHLDLTGAFDEATAVFYAGNGLLALKDLQSTALVYKGVVEVSTM